MLRQIVHGSEVGMIGKIIAIIIFACWICGFTCALTHGAFMGKVFHKLLGRHWPDLDKPVRIDGILISAHCKSVEKRFRWIHKGIGTHMSQSLVI